MKYATWEGAPFPFPLKNFQDFKMGGGAVSTASGQLRVVFHISCFWIVSISEEGGWWCHRFYSSAFTHDRTVHYSIAFQCVALCQNSLHCVKMQCTAYNTVYSAPWTSMALLLHCGWPALPPLLQCSGLNLFIGLTVGHYMQLVQGSRPRHYMQWPTTVGLGHCQPLFWVQ